MTERQFFPARRAFITGVAGFTGRYLAQTLAQAGYEVFGLAQETIEVPHVDRVLDGDLSDTSRLVEIVREVRPSVVVHLAAISFVAHGDVGEIYRTNVDGTKHLLDALVNAGGKCSNVLLVSSANVYGNTTGGVLTEETPPAPANDYALSKLAMENEAGLYRDRLPIIIARPFNYTGVGQAANFLIPKIVDHFRRRAPVIELGNLDVARDFSDVRQVVAAYKKLLESPAAFGQTFNVCSGHAYTLMEVIGMATAITGHDIEVRVNPAFVRQNEVKLLQGSCQRLISVTGEVSGFSLEETLRWMLKFDGTKQI
jgi:nucleoside-diphosphate-sugar epimerase